MSTALDGDLAGSGAPRPRCVVEVEIVAQRLPTRTLGEEGERMAAGWLRRHGMVILATNWRCAAGEIDIVARDGQDVVVVEVKTRTSIRFGTPAEAVIGKKLSRLRGLAARWLAEHPQRSAGVRIDVIAILARPGRPVLLQHRRGVS